MRGQSSSGSRHVPVGALLLSLAALAACGGGGAEGAEGAAQAPAQPGAPGAGGGPALDFPARPARVFAPQSPPVGPEYEGLVARLDPAYAGDPWQGEVVARLTERALGGSLAAALDGEEAALEKLLALDLVVSAPLRPSGGALDVLRDDAAARVVRAAAGRAEAAPDARAALDALLAPYRAGARPRVRVEVLSSGVEAGPRGAVPVARARVRLACDEGDGGRQANLVWDVTWRIGPQGTRLARISPVEFEEVLLPRRAFRDATRTALADAPRALAALGEDALATIGRTDALVPTSTVVQGMHGCAVGDVDGDGYEDLYVGRVAGAPNLLLMNGPGGRSREEAAARGVDFLDDTGGALIVDLDGDGWRDIAMGRGIDVVIAWNAGEGRFGETTTLRRANGARVYSLAAADFDGDGDLDLYDTRYFRSGGYGDQAPTPYHDARNGAPNHLWRSLHEEAPRTFRDDTQALGLDVDNDRFSLSAVWEDLDGDGDLDLYVANDFGRNSLYRNDGDRFVDIAREVGLDDMAAGMGLSLADADLDGHLDIVVSNMWAPAGSRVATDRRFLPRGGLDLRADYARHARGNSLFQGTASGRFRDVTGSAGIGPAGWAWGARFVDWDRDGLPDLVSPNGFLTGRRGPDLEGFFWRAVVGASPVGPPATSDYLAAWATITRVSQLDLVHWNGREPTYGYLNLGGLRFADASAAAGLDVREDGRAQSAVDWDRDGRLDLWTKNRSAPLLRLMRGDAAPDAAWVAFELRGLAPNTDAVGALVEVEAEGVTHRRRVRAGDGFLAGATMRAHFGLAAARALDAVRIVWPDGERTEVTGAAPGGLWRVTRRARASELAAERLEGPFPAMDADAVPLPDDVGEPRRRVPLLDTFPLGALRLPRTTGGATAVAELAGPRGLALVLAHAGVAESRDAVAELAREGPALEALGLAWHALFLDEARDAESVRAFARSLGAGEHVGRADRASRLVVDMLLGRTLAPFDDLPLPIVLLFDPRGDLGLLQVGALDLDELRADAAALADRPDGPDARWPTSLTGGRWDGLRPRRKLLQVAPKLRQVGLPELADALETAARARGDER